MPDERKVAELEKYIREVYRYRPGLWLLAAEAGHIDSLWREAGLTRQQFGAIHTRIALALEARGAGAMNN